MPPRNYRNRPRRSRLPGLLLGGAGLLALVAVGVVGTLWIAGLPLNPLAWWEPAEEDPYMVRIPINSQPIPAYSRVNREQMLSPVDRSLMFQRIPPEATVGMSIVGMSDDGSHVEGRIDSVKNVDDEVVFVVADGAEVRQGSTLSLGGALMQVNAIIGRVVKRDKRTGLGFRESTFFPKGTPEGLAGATPPGMRAITLDATTLTGVHALNSGDQIDLLASMPGDDDGVASASSSGDDARVKMLAQNARVLRPVYIRNEVSTTASLLNGERPQNNPKYEVALAIDAEDVIPLQNAINQELPITCVARSRRPVDEDAEPQPEPPADMVSVPVTVRPILAYQVVSRDAFVSPATRRIKIETISRQLADRTGVITSVNEALGAITRLDIPAGRYLRHSDLLKGPPTPSSSPADSENLFEANADQGSLSTDDGRFVALLQQQATPQAPAATAVGDRPAISRFIPSGRTAFAIPLNRIYAAEHLQIGDSLDLMASFSLEREDNTEETETRPDGTVIVRTSESLAPRTTQRTWEESFGNRAEPWFVASDAVVIAPVGFPAPAAALRALAAAGVQANNQARGNTFSGPSVIIAVESRDVESVATALATRDALFTVAMHAAGSSRATAQPREIALAPESIRAFSPLQESWQGNRRSVATRQVSGTDPRFAGALSPQQLRGYYGRVLKADKARGDFFTPDDFLPADAAPGVAATARPGHTLFPIADDEIEGLDAFEQGDQVSVLVREVLQPGQIRGLLPRGGGAARVVAGSVRIARASVAGQTILEVPSRDVARLQAVLAQSLDNGEEGRSNLVAVGIDRVISGDADPIPAFDPRGGFDVTELIIGGRRSVEVFAGAGS